MGKLGASASGLSIDHPCRARSRLGLPRAVCGRARRGPACWRASVAVDLAQRQVDERVRATSPADRMRLHVDDVSARVRAGLGRRRSRRSDDAARGSSIRASTSLSRTSRGRGSMPSCRSSAPDSRTARGAASAVRPARARTGSTRGISDSGVDSWPRRWPSSRLSPAPPVRRMPRGSRAGPPECRGGCRRCPAGCWP